MNNLATSAREILDDAPGTKKPTHSWNTNTKRVGFVKNLDFEKKVSKTDLDFCFWSALSSPVFPTQSLAHLSNRQGEPSRGFIRRWMRMFYKLDFSAFNGDKFDLFWREKEKDNKPRCSSAHLALQATPWKGEEKN